MLRINIYRVLDITFAIEFNLRGNVFQKVFQSKCILNMHYNNHRIGGHLSGSFTSMTSLLVAFSTDNFSAILKLAAGFGNLIFFSFQCLLLCHVSCIWLRDPSNVLPTSFRVISEHPVENATALVFLHVTYIL